MTISGRLRSKDRILFIEARGTGEVDQLVSLLGRSGVCQAKTLLLSFLGAVADIGTFRLNCDGKRGPSQGGRVMRRKQLQANTGTEALIMEQARLLARELERTCNESPDGHVVDRAEAVILKQGREFLRAALQASLQQQAH